MTLEQVLRDSTLRPRLLDACVAALEAEVRVSGLAMRSAYRVFRGVRPGGARGAFDRLLPSFAPVLEHHWAAASGGDPRAYFEQHRDGVADALLSVTDARVARAGNATLSNLYGSLRGRARRHVVAGVPRIADILDSVLPGRSLV